MADPFMKQLLRLWKMESLIDKFAAEEIDQHGFECLTEALISELIVPIGKRATFLNKFKEYKLLNVGVLHVCPEPQPTIEIETIAFGEIPSFEEALISNISNDDAGGSDDLDPLSMKTGNGSTAGSPKESSSKDQSKTATISYPAPLPNFSPRVLKYISDGTLLQHSNIFVQECGHFLLTLNPKPSRKDYANFSLTIVSKYPQFRDHNGSPEASMRKRITVFIRNHRHSDKKGPKKLFGPTACADLQPKPAASSAASPTKLHAELRAKHGDNAAHTKLLMRSSHSARRKWIMQEATSAKEILGKFPHFKTYNLFMYEFQLLNLTVLPDNDFNNVVSKMGMLMSETPANEPEQVSLLSTVERKLQGKRAAAFPPAIDIQEAGGSVDLLRGNPIYPVLRVFSTGASLSDVYLIVEGIVLTKMDNSITPFKCARLLLAAYYVLDIDYPPQYAQFLSFLGEVLLGQAPKSTGTKYCKFMQQYRALL